MKSHSERLVSFSLRIDKSPPGAKRLKHPDSTAHQAWLSSQCLSRLLKALPESCIDVELDTKTREMDDLSHAHPEHPEDSEHLHSTPDHLCLVLREMIPRLRHFRLRTRSLCPDLLLLGPGDKRCFAIAPRLRSMTICLCLEDGAGYVSLCVSPGAAQIAAGEQGLGLDDNDKLQTRLAETLRAAYRAGAFPQANILQIMNCPCVLRCKCIQEDCISSTTHTLPLRRLWDEPDVFDGRFYVTRNKDDEELFGYIEDVEAILEDGAWRTTSEGHRWSMDYCRSGSLCSTKVLQPQYEKRPQFLDRVARSGLSHRWLDVW